MYFIIINLHYFCSISPLLPDPLVFKTSLFNTLMPLFKKYKFHTLKNKTKNMTSGSLSLAYFA